MSELIQAYTNIDNTLSLLTVILLLVGCILLTQGISHLFRKHMIRCTVFTLSGSSFVLGAGLVFMIALNMLTYHRLTYELPVAEIHLRELMPRRFEATITYLDSTTTNRYELAGDEWQLDARVLRWPPWMQIAGFNSGYRLERLSGRYASIDDEINLTRTVYALSDNEGLDIWSLAHEYSFWLQWLDAYYGSATYLPMNNNAVYVIFMSQYGLIARPKNDTAKESLSNWQ